MTARTGLFSYGLCALALAACSNTTPPGTSELNLDRPVDVAFACWGGLRITNGAAADVTQPIESIAQPIASCMQRSLAPTSSSDNSNTIPAGQQKLDGGDAIPTTAWYAFILGSERGTVNVETFPTQPSSSFSGADISIQDTDPLVPGTNGISVGEDPVAIGTSREGCYEITANAGSCDLSVLDVTSAVDGVPGAKVDRMEVQNAAGVPIHAKPAAMAMDPASGTIGQECPAQPTGLAYIAYPGCHLVAAVDLSTDKIVAGIQFDATGVATITDGNVTCSDECGGEVTTPGTRPVTLALNDDTRTGADRRELAIGADNSSSLTVVSLALDGMPIAPVQVALEDDTPDHTLGITDVALTSQIGMGGSTGELNDDAAIDQFQFVYAVATDGTIRVASILNAPTECDTQVDPRFLHDVSNVHQLSCLPVGAASTPPRRPGARGPGIELPADPHANLPGDAVPVSVTTVEVGEHGGTDETHRPQYLVGHFAVATTASGLTYIINIDDDNQADSVASNDPIGTAIPLDIAHQVRDSIPQRSLVAETAKDADHPTDLVPICDTSGPDPDASTGNTAGPRATTSPQLTIPSGTVAAEKAGALPSIRQVQCIGNDEPAPGIGVSELSFAAPVDVRDLAFPDLAGLRRDETWTLTWEGSLSNDKGNSAVDGPGVRTSQIFVDPLGMKIDDATRPFCDAGVEPYDIVQLRGCDPTQGDSGCPIGYTCYVHPDSQVSGLGACMLKDEAERLADACKKFLTSERRYTVAPGPHSGELKLLPRRHELRTTPLDGCTSDAQCQSLADYALQMASSSNPADNATDPDTHTWKCAADPNRAPLEAPGTNLRCAEACTQDSDCDTGTVCDNGFCMEGVIPPQACVNAPQRYELRAGDAFAVLGTESGFVHPIVADAGGKCVTDPNASPWQVGRIPLFAPPCDPTADPRTGALPGGGFEPNPCELASDETELEPVYAPGTCTAGTPATVTRPADAIRFRNRGLTLTIVDPTYPGDASCAGDRGGTLANVPLVPDGYQLTFRQTAGLWPVTLNIAPSYPIKVLTGPQQSIWVVDEGDTLSSSISSASTKGQVFRIESSGLSTINVMR